MFAFFSACALPMRTQLTHGHPGVQAIHTRIAELIDAAGKGGAKIICLQEAW